MHKLGKDRQHSLRVLNSTVAHLTKYSYGASRVFLKLTSYAGRLRERTAGRSKPRETMLLFIVSVQSDDDLTDKST